jgi:hypothetical protein
MKDFLRKVTEWILEKEEAAAKSCAIPMREIDAQLERVAAQKAKLQKDYEESMAVFDELEAKLRNIKRIETLRCRTKDA